MKIRTRLVFFFPAPPRPSGVCFHGNPFVRTCFPFGSLPAQTTIFLSVGKIFQATCYGSVAFSCSVFLIQPLDYFFATGSTVFPSFRATPASPSGLIRTCCYFLKKVFSATLPLPFFFHPFFFPLAHGSFLANAVLKVVPSSTLTPSVDHSSVPYLTGDQTFGRFSAVRCPLQPHPFSL